MNTLETGEGELITVRRPGHGETKKNVQDFLPCEFCLGFFRKWDLWKHHASCPNKPPRVSRFSKSFKNVLKKFKKVRFSKKLG
jgi:hypothetical protein